MRMVKFREESERLNVPIESVAKAYDGLLHEGKIQGVIDSESGEFVQYDSREMENLVEQLDVGRVQVRELAEGLGLELGQVRLIISKLLKDNRVKGSLTLDDVFLSETEIRRSIIELVAVTGEIDSRELSRRLLISEDVIKLTISELSNQVMNALRPYQQIRLTDLGSEVKLPIDSLMVFLKWLISQGRVVGSIDLVNGVFLKESVVELRPVPTRSEEAKVVEVSKPSDAWYLLPIIFGLLGGVVGYIGVRDRDTNMAERLLTIGIFVTVLGVIILWMFYSYIVSILSRLI